MNSSIHTNLDSVRNYNVFNKNQAAASKAMSHATTGLKIASVTDGPASWAISEKMRERINSLNQASQNIQNDTALAKTAGDGIANTVEILRTLKAKIIQGADAATNDDDRNIIATEITNLLAQINDNANNVKYNGKALLNGTYANESGDGVATSSDGAGTSTFSFQVGEDSGMKVKLDIKSVSVKGLGIETSLSGITGTKLKTMGKAESIVDKLNTALGNALSAATTVGSIQNRLGYTADNVNTQIENLQASDSAIRDADMAKEISDYLKWNVLSQASQYMLAQSNQNAFSVLNLLQ